MEKLEYQKDYWTDRKTLLTLNKERVLYVMLPLIKIVVDNIS